MSSSKRRRQQQQRLNFEPVPETGSPVLGQGLSRAKVRFQSPKDGGSPSSRSVQPLKMTRSRRHRQQTLDSSLRAGKAKQPKDEEAEDGNMKVRRRQPPSPPPSSFMSKSNRLHHHVVASDSETPVEVAQELDDTDGEGPLKPEISRRRLSRPAKRSNAPVVNLDDSDDGEPNARSSQSLPNQAAASDDSDAPLATPRSSARQKGWVVLDEDGDSDEGDENEEDVQSPAKRRRLNRNTHRVTAVASSDGSESESSQSPCQATPQRKKPASPQSSTRKMRSSARKGHRSEKEKTKELLRRRRAGEKGLTMSDLDTSQEDAGEDQGGLYDTDSDHQFLDVFDDESDGGPMEPEAPAKRPEKAKKRQKGTASARQDAGDNEGTADSDGNLEGFIDEDDTIGVPDEVLYQIPLEFTRASRKPLKAHFKDAVEWLVHRRINPGFERDDEVYRTAWTRLNDEVIGLANSKWISSSWRPDFYRLLRARPYIEQAELGYGHLGTDVDKCQACGRSNHPATWAINFTGKPYDSYTLDELDNDTTTDSEDESRDDERPDRDAHGNELPPEDRRFYVGTVCNSNAEMAHNLLHWKPALRDWVGNTLEREGWLAPDKLAELDRMKPKKRRKVVDGIVEDWDERAVIKRLYGDFKENIRRAEERDTTKSSRGRSYVR